MISLKTKKMTVSGQAYAGRCLMGSMLLGMDGANDPDITVYDGTSSAGTEVIPTTTFDASALGLNGFTGVFFEFKTGIYVEITCAGAVEVTIGYKEDSLIGVF